MVRILTGTLIEVGLHKRTPESVAETLFSCDRALAGFTAPPEGLFWNGSSMNKAALIFASCCEELDRNQKNS